MAKKKPSKDALEHERTRDRIAATAAHRLGRAQSRERGFQVIVTTHGGREIVGDVTRIRIDRKTRVGAPSNLIATVGGTDVRVEEVREVESVEMRERRKRAS